MIKITVIAISILLGGCASYTKPVPEKPQMEVCNMRVLGPSATIPNVIITVMQCRPFDPNRPPRRIERPEPEAPKQDVNSSI